jgi:hypothetical protein
VVFALGAKNSQ